MKKGLTLIPKQQPHLHLRVAACLSIGASARGLTAAAGASIVAHILGISCPDIVTSGVLCH